MSFEGTVKKIQETQNTLTVKLDLRFNYDLAKISWIKASGRTACLFKPKNKQELIDFLKAFKDSKIKIDVIGNLTNTVVRDGGFDGVLIKFGRGFNRIEVVNKSELSAQIKVGAGVLDHTVAKFAIDNSLAGLEFLACIPGAIGGAIAMNAGCFNREMVDVVESITAVDRNGNVKVFKNNEIKFSYRHNPLAKDWIFTSCVLNATYGDKEKIEKHTIDLKTKKEASQPTALTCGSTFKNPVDIKTKAKLSAWRLIDEAGMRGVRKNGVQISRFHSNFLINEGKSANDIEDLIGEIQQKVLKEKEILLEPEVEFKGKK